MNFFKGTVILALLSLNAFGQDEVGLRNGNYSGVNGVFQNPSFSSTSFLKWDLNLFAGGFFVDNGYIYIENSSLLHSGLNSGNLTFNSTNPEEIAKQPSNPLYYSFFDPTRDFDFGFNAFLTGPSLALRFENFSIGGFMNFRIAFGANNIDKDLSQPSLDSWTIFESKDFDPMDAAALVWTEIGLNLSKRLVKKRDHEIYGGVNLKYNIGFDGFYVKSENDARVTAITDTTQQAVGGPVEYAFATGLDRDNEGYTPGLNGSGFGIDIGAQYIIKTFDERPYQWKLGASLLDLGYVTFTSNAEVHQVPQGDNYIIDYESLLETFTINHIVGEASTQIFGNPTESRVGSSFIVYTPFALNLTADYSINPNWYWGMMITRRLDFSAKVVERDNIMMTSLRYERKGFELGANLSVYNDIHPRVGAWIRLGPLTMGSDNITSIFLNQPRLTGTDLYFALRMYPFRGKGYDKDPLENCNF